MGGEKLCIYVKDHTSGFVDTVIRCGTDIYFLYVGGRVEVLIY